MIIVSNTGPLLHLYEADSLDLLHILGEVSIPPMVLGEFSRLVPNFYLPKWIIVHQLNGHFQKLSSSWNQAGILDPGEAEAISLAQQLNSDWFLTDDAAARLLGSSLGIEVHGSLGVILWATVSGRLDYAEAQTRVDNLFHSSLWVSPKVMHETRRALEVIFRVNP